METKDNNIISLEVFDDIGEENGDNKTAVQLKSAQKHNPISNRSVDLWKTLSNWIDSINNKELDVAD